jgi:hypothetical protein
MKLLIPKWLLELQEKKAGTDICESLRQGVPSHYDLFFFSLVAGQGRPLDWAGASLLWPLGPVFRRPDGPKRLRFASLGQRPIWVGPFANAGARSEKKKKSEHQHLFHVDLFEQRKEKKYK